MTLTQKQIAERRHYIGASDAAAALGVCPWRSRMDVWLEKTGRHHDNGEQREDGPAFWGTVLETPVAERWARLTDKRIQRWGKGYTHPHYPYLRAHLDRVVVGEKSLLEVKTTSVWRADDWGPTGSDGIALAAKLQQVAQLACASRQIAYTALLIGGQEFRHYSMIRNPDLENAVVQGLVRFWVDYVEADIPPPPLTFAEASQTWAHDTGEDQVATPAALELLDQIRQVDRERDELKTLRERLALGVQTEMRDAARHIWFEMGLALELGAGAALAALRTGRYRPQSGESVCAVVCGAGTDGITASRAPRP